jgi:hypothetical protein
VVGRIGSVIGSLYVLTSVGVTIYRRRNPPAEAATPVSENITPSELLGCSEELADVEVALEKHLESFHHLLAGYEPDEASVGGMKGLCGASGGATSDSAVASPTSAPVTSIKTSKRWH